MEYRSRVDLKDIEELLQELDHLTDLELKNIKRRLEEGCTGEVTLKIELDYTSRKEDYR